MRSTVINNRVWLVDYTNSDLDGDKDGLTTYGAVGSEGNSTRPIEGLLQIDGTLCGKELLNVIVHEWLHALLPFAQEEWVAQEADNLCNLLSDRVTLTKIGLFNNIIVQVSNNEKSTLELGGNPNPTEPNRHE